MNVPNELWCRLGLGIEYGNAASWAELDAPGRVRLDIRQVGRLKVGDTLVWRSSAEMPDGHTAVVLWGRARTCLILEQNDPLGGAVRAAWIPSTAADVVQRVAV